MTGGTNKEGLIELPTEEVDGATRPARPGVLGRVVIAWTALILVGTAAIDTVAPVSRPRLKGVERVLDLKRRKEAHVLDGSLARLIEYDYRLTSRVRRTIAQPYTDLLFHQLRETSSEVLIGSDDWLFLERRAQWPAGSGALGIERIGALEAALASRAAAHGVRVLWMHIPRKAAIEEKHLPRGVKPRMDLEEEIVPRLRARGVEAIDLLAPFLRMTGAPAYRKTDSHWSSYGRTLAALETATQAGLLAPPKERLGKLKRGYPKGRYGAILNTLSVTPTPALQALEPEDVIVVTKAPPRGALSPGTISGTSFSSDGLAKLLGHYVGHTFEAFFNEGGAPYDKLGEIFRSRLDDGQPETKLPELMVIDVPNHIVTLEGRYKGRWQVNPGAAQWLADFAPPTTYPKGPAREWRTKEFAAGTPVAFSGSRAIAAWNSGEIAHSGEGSACFELDVTVDGGAATLAFATSGTTLQASLPEGAHRLVLPLIAVRPEAGGGRIILNAKSQASVSVRSCGLVSAFPGVSANEEPQIQRHGAVWIETLKEGKRPWSGNVRVATADGSDSQVFRLTGIRPGAPIVVVPGKLIGRRLGAVTLEGPPDLANAPDLSLGAIQLHGPLAQ